MNKEAESNKGHIKWYAQNKLTVFGEILRRSLEPGAICDFRQSLLRRSSKLSSPYTESNEQLVSSIEKMMKMNYRYLISEI